MTPAPDATAELERTNALLQRALDEAIAANRAKSEFLANMSHELRTPLNSVIGFAQVLMRKEGGQFTAQDAAFLRRIHDNGSHLLGLINGILDLAKIESGRLELDLAPVALDALVDETLALLQGSIRDRPITLERDCPAHLAPFESDAAKLRQVLINLVGNALKFTESGSVTVRVHADASGRPEHIDIVDTGIGIPADRLEAIFGAFEQADNTTARRFGGTGLGLAITRSLLGLLGYRVTVHSEVGRGSTFRIDLAGTKAERPRVRVDGATPAFRSLIEDRVSAAGADVVCGGNEPPALVVVGVAVPGMQGLELAEAARPAGGGEPPVLVVGILDSPRTGTVVAAAELYDGSMAPDALTSSLWNQLEGPPGVAEERLAGLLRQGVRPAT